MLREPGYVLVAYADRVMETSLWFAILLLTVLFAVLRLLVFITMRTFRGGQFFDAWRSRRGEAAAAGQTQRGLLLLAEGEWLEAKKLLVGSAQNAAQPIVNFLNAARAAHELGETDERDELLSRAQASTPGAEVAISLARARLQMESEQWEACRATLLPLRQQHARHPQILALLMRCYEALRDWQPLVDLVPELRKAKAADEVTLDAIERRAWAGLLDTADYAEIWRRLPRELKREPELVSAWAQRLITADEPAAAEQAVRKAINRNWHEGLVALYGCIASPRLSKQLAAAESWLKEHPDDPALLLALGRIAMMGGAWSKAREYLEASLRLEPAIATHGELGRLLNHLGEFIRGNEHLGMACVDLPNVQLPPRPGR